MEIKDENVNRIFNIIHTQKDNPRLRKKVFNKGSSVTDYIPLHSDRPTYLQR